MGRRGIGVPDAPHGGLEPLARGSRTTSVLIRESGRWSVARLDHHDPVDVASASVLAFGASESDDPPASEAIDPALSGQVAHSVAPLAFLVRDGQVLASDPADGQLTPLTVGDLALLDRIDGPLPIDELTADGTGAGLRTVLRLRRLGLIRVGSLADVIPVDRTPHRDWPTQFVRPDGAWQQLDGQRIPVIPAYVPTAGPPLALGLIMAHARRWQDGRLAAAYDLRQPMTVDEARVVIGQLRGPAVLLCSNYMWTSRQNHDLAAWAKQLNPLVTVIHGGPDAPKYDDDLERFLDLPSVDIAVIGEGEETACELLAALADAGPSPDLSGLAEVAGIAYRATPDGPVTRTPGRDRRADLDELPSPYLTGEFDDLHPAAWDPSFEGSVVIETNRGCPYKCTFCDWGSATMSRIRRFDLDRVEAEMQWLADRRVAVWMLADANVGILPRDVDVARMAARMREDTGVPLFLGINTAKNTTRYLPDLLRALFDAGIATVSSLALQTRDERTLEVIRRSNITPESYDDLCATFRSLGLPIMCDFILGLPGATVSSFKDDLQWAFDHEVTARAWLLQILPNAPMNEPAYRSEHAIEADDDGMVVSTTSFTRDDHEHMLRIRMAFRVLEHFGLLRHVLRWLQWDHGLRAIDVMDDLVAWTDRHPERAPLLTYVLRYFDYFPIPPVGWDAFFDEVRGYLLDRWDIAGSSAMDSVFEVQRALMPDRGRSYPHVVGLAHDYPAYYRDATETLATSGAASGPPMQLDAYPPGEFTVVGDPARLVDLTFRRLEEHRPIDLVPKEFWQILHYEVDSTLTRFVPEVRANKGFTMANGPSEGLVERAAASSTAVQLTSRPSDAGAPDEAGSPIGSTHRRTSVGETRIRTVG